MDDTERLDRLVDRARDLPPEQAVSEAAAFFAGLDPEAATRLADTRPDQVGELDGAPMALRFRSNHLRLVRDRDQLRATVEAGGASSRDRTRLRTLDTLLTPTHEVGLDASGRPGLVAHDRQFLSVRTEGRGQAVEVLGDPATAKNVAVLVPGMGNTLESVEGQAARAQVIRNEAGPGTAAVVWIGYESPPGVPGAASKQPAWDAAPDLRRFQVALDAAAPEARTTLIGHSYGATVVGQAVLYGARFDNLVLTGSAGIDPDVRSVADLAAPGTKVFAARSPGDYVAYTQWHGPDPASYPDVVRMQTAGGVGVNWHNEYYRPNSESLRNIGRVVRGDHAAVTTTGTSPAAETKLAAGVSWAGVVRGAAVPVSLVYEGIADLRGVTPPPRARSPGQTATPAGPAGTGRRKDGPSRPEGPQR